MEDVSHNNTRNHDHIVPGHVPPPRSGRGGECDRATSSTPESSALFPMSNLTSSSLASRWADEGSMADPSSAMAIRLTTKPCPKCRTATERSGGCMHMTCTRDAQNNEVKDSFAKWAICSSCCQSTLVKGCLCLTLQYQAYRLHSDCDTG